MRPTHFIERRQHRRIITVRNCSIVFAVSVLAFLGITIRSEMRGSKTQSYGRLYETQVVAEVKQKPVEVVREAPAPVPDQSHADPMLVEPLSREQWLHDNPQPPTYNTAAAAQVVGTSEGDSRVTIVGGPEGVTVVRETRRKPVLSGGFGR
jgi:hypothetical protein